MTTENTLIAAAAMRAVIESARADGIEVPQRIAADLLRLEAATRQRITKIVAGMTAPTYGPDGPLPNNVRKYEWHTARLTGKLHKHTEWPGVKIVEPVPCYTLHVSGNGIAAESWLREAGYAADSNAPFRCTLLEIK